MRIHSQWWTGVGRQYRHTRLQNERPKAPTLDADLGSVQPSVMSIDDNDRRFVGLIIELDYVRIEMRVDDPLTLRAELGDAILWQDDRGDAS